MALPLLLFAVLGGVLIAVSLPLRKSTFAPEQIFGNRTPPVLKNRAIWAEVYDATLRGLAWAGAGIIASTGLLYLIPGMNTTVYAILGLLAVVICLGGGLYSGWRTMQRFERPTRRTRPPQRNKDAAQKSRRNR